MPAALSKPTVGGTDYATRIAAFFDAWNTLTAYTPTITAAAGTFTSVSATGKWASVGPFIAGIIDITVTTVGTAATSITASLPSTAAGNGVMVGREINSTLKAVTGRIDSGSANASQIVYYDNTFPGASGTNVRVFFIYPAF